MEEQIQESHIIEYRKFIDENNDTHSLALVSIDGKKIWRYRTSKEDSPHVDTSFEVFKDFNEFVLYFGMARMKAIEVWVRDGELGTIKYQIDHGYNEITIHETLEFISKEEMLL